MEDFLTGARALGPELAALRAAFHREPETGRREFHTARRLELFFAELGVPTRRLGPTAVLAELAGALPGPTAAFRADMDALPVQEQTGAACASEIPGAMHACGHDFHMTAALGAAKLLAARRDSLRGCVRFLFEPDEEGSGGAAAMVKAGAMDGVSAVFGAHVSPELPAGTAGIRFGKFYAASNPFSLRLTGKTAHAAEPEKGIDAVYAAARAACALKQLQEPLTQRFGRAVVTVGSLHAGTACNILAGVAELTGILRTLGPDARREGLRLLRGTAERIARETGVLAELSVTDGYAGVVNDDRASGLALAAAQAVLGPGRVQILPKPTMMTEDFGCFLDKAPGCFYHIGVGGAEPLHSPRFYPPDALLPGAAALAAGILQTFLEHPDFTVQEESPCRPSH